MDLNNQQKLICHNQPINQPTTLGRFRGLNCFGNVVYALQTKIFQNFDSSLYMLIAGYVFALHPPMYVSVHVVYVCLCACVCIFVYVCMCVYMCVCMYVCVLLYAQIKGFRSENCFIDIICNGRKSIIN